MLLALLLQAPPALGHLPASVGQLLQGDDARLVGVEQAAVLPPQPLEPGGEPLRLGAFLGVALGGELGLVSERRQQTPGVVEQTHHVRPDRVFQLGARDGAAGADPPAAAEDGVLAGAPARGPSGRRGLAAGR